MKNPKISVIIPVYNGEKTMAQCLDSVLNQTYKNYEIIVVDNNSTDKTKEIIKESQEKNKRIIYLFESQKGRGSARNTGEKKARGEIVLMTDSDCIVPKNWIREMKKSIECYDAVQGFEEPVFNNLLNAYEQARAKKGWIAQKEICGKKLIGKIDTKNFAIKKKILKKIGLTSRKYFSGNDKDLSIKMAKNKCLVIFKKNIKVKHFHPNSLRKLFNKQIYRAKWITIITQDHKDFLKKSNFLEESNQTPYSFFIFFPGLFTTLIKKGPKYTFYEFITGISWRIGLIEGWLIKC